MKCLIFLSRQIFILSRLFFATDSAISKSKISQLNMSGCKKKDFEFWMVAQETVWSKVAANYLNVVCTFTFARVVWIFAKNYSKQPSSIIGNRCNMSRLQEDRLGNFVSILGVNRSCFWGVKRLHKIVKNTFCVRSVNVFHCYVSVCAVQILLRFAWFDFQNLNVQK